MTRTDLAWLVILAASQAAVALYHHRKAIDAAWDNNTGGQMGKWLALAKLIGPIIVASINPKLAPVATAIADGVGEAEQIPGSTGPGRQLHVANLGDKAVVAYNATNPPHPLDPTEAHEAVIEATDTLVAVLNAAHPAKVATGK